MWVERLAERNATYFDMNNELFGYHFGDQDQAANEEGIEVVYDGVSNSSRFTDLTPCWFLYMLMIS